MRPLIEAGYVYAACPPLYKVYKKKGKGEEVHYLYTPEELKAFDTEGYLIQRYKGLGEMNPEQLWETTMDPEQRRLIQITLDDCESAEEALSVCMGGETKARKKFILECA
jgi:DNA gyrase/topoisomerase IV subunit B